MRTVLVIDDDPLIREMLSDNFKKEGFRVFLAEDGERGFELLKKVMPDAIVLDKVMPKVSGARFMLRTREIQLPKKPVLVFYSSLVKESYLEADPGIFACVNHHPKSTGPEELVKMVKDLMEQYQEPKKLS